VKETQPGAKLLVSVGVRKPAVEKPRARPVAICGQRLESAL
jgi:hypothetical protein